MRRIVREHRRNLVKWLLSGRPLDQANVDPVSLGLKPNWTDLIPDLSSLEMGKHLLEHIDGDQVDSPWEPLTYYENN